MMTSDTRAIGRATSVPVREWQVQSSSVVGQGGKIVSRADYRVDGWLGAPARSTVMAALLANGHYPDPFRSTRLRDGIDAGQFLVPWWYRTLFTVAGGGRTWLRIGGVIHRAELWCNGVLVAGPDEIAGAYPVHTVDVTDLVVHGSNAIALRVLPGDPMTDLSVGWIDWNPAPPDANMGIWRDVEVLRTGDVRLADPYAVSELSASLDRARLRVGMDLHNAAAVDRVVTVTGSITPASGHAPACGPAPASTGAPARRNTGEPQRFRTEVTVPAGQSTRVVLTPAEVAELSIADPAVWWPLGHGDQPLYDLRLVATVDGDVSDQATVTFGIRQVTSHLEPGGGRRFVVNGRPIQVLGGGWCPDIFLRHDRQRLVDQLAYTVDLGLNAIRLEGKLENPEFFEIADRMGIMVLPGWECCTKWESHAGTGGAPWTEQDFAIARRSMASEARALRNHPSVISFQIGSDFAPCPCLAEIYLEELRAADWSVPIVSSGASRWNNEPDQAQDVGPGAGPSTAVTAGVPGDTTSTAGAGPSGMKMWPYDWVPPRYWYDDRFGAAIGFDSECSAGHSIPRLPSLRAMLEPAEIDRLWQQPDAHHYHAAPKAPFDSLEIFHTALAARYGGIINLNDFLRKAQLANYEMVRAQFEAYRSRATAERPATGVIYWMLNSAWPSLNWHLFDYDLDPAGAYFGAKKANEPLHIQISYDTGDVMVVNRTPLDAGPFTARVRVRGPNGGERDRRDLPVTTVPGGGVATVTRVDPPPDVAGVYFVELELEDDTGSRVSRNVYWLSTQQDVLDWDRTSWQYTPQSAYADFTGLQDLPATPLDVTTAAAPAGPTGVTTVTVRNPTEVPAVGVHLSLAYPDTGRPVAPIVWQDNDITLFGGQAVTVSARYACPVGRPSPEVRVEGFNIIGAAARPPDGRAVPVADPPDL